jgi:hypothetical protein
VNFNPFSSQKKEELIMGIKQDKDGTYIVAYSKRHPQTRSPVVMRRKGIKSKAEANRVLAELIIIVSDKLKKVITPAWPKLLGNYLKFLFIGCLVTDFSVLLMLWSRQRNAGAICKILEGLWKIHSIVIAEERKNIARLVTAKAMVDLLDLGNREAGRFFDVIRKRTAAHQAATTRF